MATNKKSDVKLTLHKSPELYAAIFRDYYGALLQSTGREGMSNLLELLSSHGYYSSRCARHHKFVGGTLQHSLEVCHYMLEHNRDQLDRNSIIVTALLHDVCNIRGYNDIHHHGSRSARIIRDIAHFELTNDEEQAILWHLHGQHEAGQKGQQFDDCLQNNKLHRLLREADGHSAAHGLSRPELEQILKMMY